MQASQRNVNIIKISLVLTEMLIQLIFSDMREREIPVYFHEVYRHFRGENRVAHIYIVY